MRSPFTSQFALILKVMVLSAIASAAVKFGLPLLPAFSSIAAHDLPTSMMNGIAIAAITLPVAIYALILWLRR
ncbi:hypothetical protein V2H45_11235 [Tumidithrix elongata RA019]|uniref:Uncharacterized protein n=1 Tax=Tumidithrix elongata BACA0141 TaxID=2716417 RepID=A0AAW9Q294_9CYAN|nr:hypothetical protein [Tumidithrix elongata RA019]